MRCRGYGRPRRLGPARGGRFQGLEPPKLRHPHEQVGVGDTLEALAPRGLFLFDPSQRRGAVLIGAGVGITPMVSFVRHLVHDAPSGQGIRPTHLIQIAHDSQARAFGSELNELIVQSGGAITLDVITSDGAPGTIAGPLTIDLLKRLLPFDDRAFFLCGPPGFMQSMYDGLREHGVSDHDIHAESFGPAALQRRPDGNTSSAIPLPAVPAATEATVVFRRSGASAIWTPSDGTLLEFAEVEGHSPPYACRAGYCGSCATPLLTGSVTYAEPTSWTPADGEVLLCCARPAAGSATVEIDI